MVSFLAPLLQTLVVEQSNHIEMLAAELNSQKICVLENWKSSVSELINIEPFAEIKLKLK